MTIYLGEVFVFQEKHASVKIFVNYQELLRKLPMSHFCFMQQMIITRKYHFGGKLGKLKFLHQNINGKEVLKCLFCSM